MNQEHIDELLARYLGLLDEYTQLRRELSGLQSGVYQNIARANFAAERGLRYGQDHYDDRMQALRVLEVAAEDATAPSFRVVKAASEARAEEAVDPPAEDEEKDEGSGEPKAAKEGDDRETEDAPKQTPKQPDPLRWFGILAPAPLRAAQASSVEVVERVIPRLVSVNAEMLHLEIEVGRARKKRAKAEAAVQKASAHEGDSSVDAAQFATGTSTTTKMATTTAAAVRTS